LTCLVPALLVLQRRGPPECILQLLDDADPRSRRAATWFPDGGHSLYKILYTVNVAASKPVEFRGSSLEDLRAFPLTARREAGHQLDRVQNGREPDDWKPMSTVGRGAKEIRIRDEAGAFRVLYVAKFADAIYVLHCFQKKTEKTSKADLGLAAKRYRELLKELGQ
jgi:phage-related protein